MNRNLKKYILIFSIIIISVISFVISRSRVFENELYVKLLSEKTYFIFSKHKANQQIIKDFKRIKASSFVNYVKEDTDYLLYKNETDVLRIIQVKNGMLENNLYKPKFTYEQYGKYVHFVFEDELLECVDGIMMNLQKIKEEKNLYYIPVNTLVPKYEFILRIDELEESNLQDFGFGIEYVRCRRLPNNELSPKR